MADMTGYRYLVETDGPVKARRRYDGTDAAGAMAAWTAAILDGVEYVTLEALRATTKPPAEPPLADTTGGSQ